jgi:uncharacterized DUF497 family protein
VGYKFEWDKQKAEANRKKHGVMFEEGITVFGDPLSLNMPDPDHSEAEQRYIVMGFSDRYRLLVVCYTEIDIKPESSALVKRRVLKERAMKKSSSKSKTRRTDEDTMRPEYDFSKATRGVTAARYAEGTNVVLLDADVLEIFPNARAVNEALRTFARLTKSRRSSGRKQRTA